MALDPEQLSDFQVAKNMIRRLVNEKGYSLEDAVEIVTRNLDQTVRSAIRSNVLADNAPAMNAEVDRTVQEKAREQAQQRAAEAQQREYASVNPVVGRAVSALNDRRAQNDADEKSSEAARLTSFYSERERDPTKVARMVAVEMGRRDAAQKYADELAAVQKIKAAQKAESQDSFMTTTPAGRAIASFMAPSPTNSWLLPKAKPNEDPDHDAKLEARQRALSQVSAIGPVVYGSPLQEQTPEQYANDLLRNRTMRDTLLNMGEKRSVLGRVRMPNPTLAPSDSITPPDTRETPRIVRTDDGIPGWGRKVEGPSASTNEMDSSDLSETSPAAPAAAPSLVDRVHPNDMAGGNAPAYAPIGRNFSLPIFARPNKGAAPVAAYVQDRSVNPGLIEMAKTSLAPYSMQFKDSDLMRFSEDKPRVVSPRREETPSAAPQQGGGFFANAFKDPYAGMTSQQLWAEYNKTGDPGMFVRADKAMMAERGSSKKSDESEEPSKAKGGAVAGKDAAIHKALEIIQHMLTRGH